MSYYQPTWWSMCVQLTWWSECTMSYYQPTWWLMCVQPTWWSECTVSYYQPTWLSMCVQPTWWSECNRRRWRYLSRPREQSFLSYNTKWSEIGHLSKNVKVGYGLSYTGEFTKRVEEMLSQLFVTLYTLSIFSLYTNIWDDISRPTRALCGQISDSARESVSEWVDRG